MTTATDSSPNAHNPSADTAATAALHPLTTSAAQASAVLPRIFAVDRVVGAVSAAGLMVGGVLIADILDWPAWVVIAIGAGLAPYAYLLHTICRRRAYRSGLARFTAVGDAAWVVASIALLIGWPGATSTAGIWIIAAVAVAVADIGLIKLYGWTRR